MLAVALSAILAVLPVEDAFEPLRYDPRGRPVISVHVNEQGPFDMVLDTGAQSSLLAPALAERLKLPLMDSDMRIVGATGGTTAVLYPVDHLANALLDERDVALFRFPNAQVTTALGILGMETFGDRQLVFDRAAGRVVARPSAAAQGSFVALKGRRGDNGLLLVPLVLNGVTIEALVDTGASATIANAAAMRALGFTPDDPRLAQAGQIRGATADYQGVRSARLESVKIGPATLRDVPIYFTGSGSADAKPEIILGTDLLNLFDAFALDFPRAEFHVRIPARPAAPAPAR